MKTQLTPTERRLRTSVLKIFRDDGIEVKARPDDMSAEVFDTLGVPIIHFEVTTEMPPLPQLFRRMANHYQPEAIILSTPTEVPFVAVSIHLWTRLVRDCLELDKYKTAEFVKGLKVKYTHDAESKDGDER
jgi:hypothetical protein